MYSQKRQISQKLDSKVIVRHTKSYVVLASTRKEANNKQKVRVRAEASASAGCTDKYSHTGCDTVAVGLAKSTRKAKIA